MKRVRYNHENSESVGILFSDMEDLKLIREELSKAELSSI